MEDLLRDAPILIEHVFRPSESVIDHVLIDESKAVLSELFWGDLEEVGWGNDPVLGVDPVEDVHIRLPHEPEEFQDLMDLPFVFHSLEVMLR